MKFLAGFVTAFILCALGAFLVIVSGVYNVAATAPHTALVRVILNWTMRNSVRAHAGNELRETWSEDQARKRLQSLSCLRRETTQDAGAETFVMSMDRGANDPLDAIGRRRLDRKLATPSLQECSKLFWNSSDGRQLISQPTFEQLSVGDARLAETEQLLGFRSMTLPGSAGGGMVSVVALGLDAKLSSQAFDSLGADFRRLPGKPSMFSMKQEQQGEPETIGDIFRHDKRPRADGIVVIDLHFSGSVRSFATASSVQQNLAFSCRKSKISRDDICDKSALPCWSAVLGCSPTIRISPFSAQR